MIAEYFREKDGAETILVGDSFLAFIVIERQFLITDFYLGQEARKSPKHFYGIMREAFKLAVENDCRFFTCKIPLTHKNLSDVVKTRLKFGFKIVAANTQEIQMALSLQECTWAAVE